MAKNSKVQQVLSNKGDAIDDSAEQMQEVDAPEAPPDTATGTRASREDRIRLAAYAAAERRGFAPGSEEQDWLDAERQIDAEGDESIAPASAS
ncbi:DUF2934 domain-containing protein [Pseudorhodoferax sp. Leaf267]|uniref:DUF2934 domain-containing protein n=1 Tax=Pseudorhodoferax sp. Leaf267 TaxID=1736316 RepID=UPI0006F3A0E3|nr:DUF2934 domain-containing protein [Pseudorhodoferax sp. Leaf267]KQP23246.1 hypothetical protein ASF43_05075 [Pseudorhodoferax sp. Leaf267]